MVATIIMAVVMVTTEDTVVMITLDIQDTAIMVNN